MELVELVIGIVLIAVISLIWMAFSDSKPATGVPSVPATGAQSATPPTGTKSATVPPTVQSALSGLFSSFTQQVTNPAKWSQSIADKFQTIEEVQEALKTAGLESSNLVLGIDYTKSNEYTGKISFQGRSLHTISSVPNPYQKVIEIIGKTLEEFDDDKLIPVYGFGDSTTRATQVFPFFKDRSANGFQEVLTRYAEITPNLQLSGPTNFAPIIYQTINLVKNGGGFHILVIIADGQVTNEQETINAIVECSSYPISIIVIGVGDGPWGMMNEFDDGLPQRKFDNFQFVPFNDVMNSGKNPEVAFAVAALMEVPEQYKLIRKLKLL